MKDVCRVVHAVLKGAVEMGESFSATSEAHTLTEVIPAFVTVIAVATHDASLDGDPLAWYEIFDAWSYSSDDTCSLMAEDKWSLNGKVSIPSR